MTIKAIYLAIFGFLSGISLLSAAPNDWRTYDGQMISANLIDFDYGSKTAILRNPETGARANYSTRDLEFHSKRRILLSPIFHKSYPSDGFWPREKITLFGIAVLAPIVLLISGMWLAGMFFARTINPFSALGAFLGSWIAGVILVICYLIFDAKSGGGSGLIWIGGLIATAVMSLYISGIFRTTFVRGFLIFVAHFLFAALIAFLLIVGSETLFPANEVELFWDKWVFKPTGLVDGPPRDGY